MRLPQKKKEKCGKFRPAVISSRDTSSSGLWLSTGNLLQSMDSKIMPADHISMAVVWCATFKSTSGARKPLVPPRFTPYPTSFGLYSLSFERALSWSRKSFNSCFDLSFSARPKSINRNMPPSTSKLYLQKKPLLESMEPNR